jgi:hypothetical protein
VSSAYIYTATRTPFGRFSGALAGPRGGTIAIGHPLAVVLESLEVAS